MDSGKPARPRYTYHLQSSSSIAWEEKVAVINTLLGTSLGAFAIPPSEIRLSIWAMLFTLEEVWYQALYAHDPAFHLFILWNDPAQDLFRCRIFPDGYHLGDGWKDLAHALGGLRLASTSLRLEVEDLFVSSQLFYFDEPLALMNFCKYLPSGLSRRLRHVVIGIEYCQQQTRCSWWKSHRGKERHGDDDIDAWTNALTWLPTTMRSITIKMLGAASNKSQQRRALYMVCKTIKENSPIAAVRISRYHRNHHSGHHRICVCIYCTLPDKDRAINEAVMEVAMKDDVNKEASKS